MSLIGFSDVLISVLSLILCWCSDQFYVRFLSVYDLHNIDEWSSFRMSLFILSISVPCVCMRCVCGVICLSVSVFISVCLFLSVIHLSVSGHLLFIQSLSVWLSVWFSVYHPFHQSICFKLLFCLSTMHHSVH